MDDDRIATSYTFGSLLVRTGAVLAAFVAPVAFGIAGAAGVFGTDGLWQRIAFVPIGLVLGAVYGYLALFRIAYRLRIADSRLHWRAVLRGGSAPLTDVRQVVPHSRNYTSVCWLTGGACTSRASMTSGRFSTRCGRRRRTSRSTGRWACGHRDGSGPKGDRGR